MKTFSVRSNFKNPGSKLCFFLGFLVLGVLNGFGQRKLNLKTLEGAKVDFRPVVHGKISVILMVSPTCPLCKKYGRVLHDLETSYQKKRHSVSLCFSWSGP